MASWKKVLYVKQPYPDNYVEPEQFLDGLRKNLYTKTYTLRELILSSTVVSLQLTCVCLFVGLYWFVQETWLHPLTLFTTSTALTTVGFLVVGTVSVHRHGNRSSLYTIVTDLISDNLFSSFIFILFLSGVSPILRTLTESVSTDTIWAMTVGMMTLHMIFHNYGNKQGLVSSSISLNAAIFGSVCLASRLSSALDAFVIVVVAVQVFALLPSFIRRCTEFSQHSLPLLLLVMLGCTLPVMASISWTGMIFYLLAVCVVTFLCPAWLHQLQHLKNTIHGPWDEATLCS